MPRKDSANPKPRGRMTGYAFFVQTCREEHKRKHPDEPVVFAEFSKKCAERWKTMVEKEKKRFQDMADRDKMRYEHEMETYIPPAGAMIKGRGRKTKKQKDPNAPKRALSAFFWFCGEYRGAIKDQNPEYGIGDVAKELGKMWGEVDADTKRKYEHKSEQDKQRYEQEMAAYKARCSQAQPEEEEEEEEEEDDE